MCLYEFRKRRKYKKQKINNDLKKEYGITDEHKRKMFQYSKMLTTIVLFITIAINIYYFLYIVPQSGMLLITDAAFQYSSAVLKIWNGGTIVFFCGYFAKSLFETKFEKESEIVKDQSSEFIEKLKQEASEVMDEINN